tara:strand:- start:30 stop:662 length:633 start_codon:yes stop_codon:yes gene_type:complete
VHQINNEKIQELFLNIHNLPVLKTNKLFGQENNNKIKNLILDYEKNNPVGMDSNVKAWSSDYETHQKTDVFADYLNYILQFSQNAYNEMFSVNQEIIVAEFWLSHYRKGDYTVKHNHGNLLNDVIISGCYYVDIKKGASPIIFEGEEPIYPENDTLIIFSSKLNHEVPPTNSERIVMSFNFYRSKKSELTLNDYQNIADIIMSNPHNLST